MIQCRCGGRMLTPQCCNVLTTCSTLVPTIFKKTNYDAKSRSSTPWGMLSLLESQPCSRCSSLTVESHFNLDRLIYTECCSSKLKLKEKSEIYRSLHKWWLSSEWEIEVIVMHYDNSTKSKRISLREPKAKSKSKSKSKSCGWCVTVWDFGVFWSKLFFERDLDWWLQCCVFLTRLNEMKFTHCPFCG